MRWMASVASILLASIPALAQAQTEPVLPLSWPQGPNATLPKGELVLSGATKIEYASITFEDGATITTMGNELDLLVQNTLDIRGRIVIRSFPPDLTPSQPAAVKPGELGEPSYYPGPEAQGDVPGAQDGAAGGVGQRGNPGTSGTDGSDAGIITLRFGPGAKASGKLVVVNVGGRGGDGGPGGTGGQGGSGQQGGRCNGLLGNPGEGGAAGNGGPGGLGGRGGNGGRGGQIIVVTGSDAVAEWIARDVELSVVGGRPGVPGVGGKGGEPGTRGYGGRGGKGCMGDPASHRGAPGTKGLDETGFVAGATSGAAGFIRSF